VAKLGKISLLSDKNSQKNARLKKGDKKMRFKSTKIGKNFTFEKSTFFG